MFTGVTAPAILTQAGLFAAAIDHIVLLVVGLAIAFILANWIIAKVRSR